VVAPKSAATMMAAGATMSARSARSTTPMFRVMIPPSRLVTKVSCTSGTVTSGASRMESQGFRGAGPEPSWMVLSGKGLARTDVGDGSSAAMPSSGW
jgi:hypothetical protein